MAVVHCGVSVVFYILLYERKREGNESEQEEEKEGFAVTVR